MFVANDLVIQERLLQSLIHSFDLNFCLINVRFGKDGELVDYQIHAASQSLLNSGELVETQQRGTYRLHPSLETEWFGIIEKAVSACVPIPFERSTVTSQRWYELHAFSIGQPESDQILIRIDDITERRKLELSAAEKLKCYQQMVDFALEGIHLLDDEGNLIEANDSFCRLLGYSNAEILKLNVVDWDVKLPPDILMDKFRKMLDGRAAFETINRRKDGALVEVEINAVGIALNGRKCLYVASRDVTARKNLERELKQREQYQRALLDNFPFAVWLKDADSRYLTVNKAFANVQGANSPDEVVGKDDFAISSPEVAEACVKEDEEVMDTLQQKCSQQSFFVGEETRHFEIRKAPVIDANCELLGTVGYLRDITDSHRAESLLRETEGKLRAIFETMSEAVALNEVLYGESSEIVDYRILEVNRAFYSTADFHGQEVVGSLATRLYGMPTEVIRTFWESHRHSADVTNTEFFSPLSNRYFMVATSPLINHRFVTSFFDITDRKNAEIAVRQSEHFVRTIADGIPGVLGYWTRELRCGYANTGYQKWFGRSMDEMRGIRLQDLLGEELFQVNKPHIDAVLRGENQEFERVLTNKNVMAIHAFIQYIAHEVDGEVIGFFAIATDNSKTKHAEARLKIAQNAAENHVDTIKLLKQNMRNLNITLSTLIKHKEAVAQDDKFTLSRDLEQVIVPFLKQLNRDASGSRQKTLIKIIDTNLKQLVASYGRATGFSHMERSMTPKEVQIASMIRQGLSSKEIASTLSLSLSTVSNHRKNIRKKLGLNSMSENLQSNLIALRD